MDDGRLDRLEEALRLNFRNRQGAAALPQDFTARVMRAVRARHEHASGFWDIFSCAARRFAPVGALAATVACGYAEVTERVVNQALLSVSLHGGFSTLTLAALLP